VRVAIVGNSGSGKSTLARQLADTYALASLDLDTIAWEKDAIAVARQPERAAADVTAFCAAHARWVIEGCYESLIAHAFAHAPILVFIDPGVEACLANCGGRPWEPHKYVSKEDQDAQLAFLLSWVRDYYARDGELSHAAHVSLFESYAGRRHHLTRPPGREFVMSLGPCWYGDAVDDLAARFQACTLRKDEWTHEAHLTVGFWHVERYGRDEALTRLRGGIRRLNESHGNVNSTTGGYHETITAAYVTLLSEYSASCGPECARRDWVVRLLASRLADRKALLTFYSRDVLMSTDARAAWVNPDLEPLSAARLFRSGRF
jgi:adenylate kinase family enzyme